MTVEENIARLIYNISNGENLATMISANSTKQDDIKNLLDKLVEIFEIVYHDELAADSDYIFVH